ncbi:MAG: hypothetical protein V1773_06665 [bacterium]
MGIARNIEQRVKDNQKYNLPYNNCGQTAVELINSPGSVYVITDSRVPSSVYNDKKNVMTERNTRKKRNAEITIEKQPDIKQNEIKKGDLL